MIAGDILQRLPDQARSKLVLLSELSDEALDPAQSGQQRLNDQARKYPGVDAGPSAVRLGAAIADADHRREELHRLIGAVSQWVRSVPENPPLEPIAVDPPPLEASETVGAAVMRIQGQIAELTAERFHVSRAPEPKAELVDWTAACQE
jgi:hypothetical protein